MTTCRKASYSRYMEAVENLEKLALGLSPAERQTLLEKLNDQTALTKGPLYFEDEKTAPAYDLEAEFSKLPFLYRLWYLILSFFNSKTPGKLFEDSRISILGNMVETKSPGLYDYQKALLLPGFHRHMQRLKDASHFFYAALDSSVNRDKGAFFAFLGSLEMEDVHKKLSEETAPDFIAKKYPDMQEGDLRQMANKAMDEALAMIKDQYKTSMYFNARSLNCLKDLSSFLYDRVLMAFHANPAAGGQVCSVGIVRDLLLTLNNMLCSLKTTPPIPLLESLFVFILQERASEPGFDVNHEIHVLLVRAQDSLTVIRDFNKNVPLTWILRCSTRNMSLSPKETSGGEDWFVYYKDYWKRRIDSSFANYMKDRVERDLQDSFRTFLKGKSLKRLENAQSPTNTEGLPLKGAFTLAFLNTFHSEVFMPDLNWVLKIIMINGEWHKKENRLEFIEGYNNLVKLDDEIKKIEHEISSEGEYGKRYAQAKQEMSPLQVKRRKTQIVVEEASEDAEKIVGPVKEATESIINLLTGIIGKDTTGKYETLINLAKIATMNTQFTTGLNDVIEKFKTVRKIFQEIDDTENGK